MRTIRDCPVCVVGGAGFLGSHLVRYLIEDRGCRVLVVDNFESGRAEFIHERADFAHHDITGSEDHLRQLFERHKIRFAWNLAARPYVPDSYDRPLRTFDVNAIGALKVIHAAQESGCEAILQVSSAEIYGSGKVAADWDQNLHRTDGHLDEDSPVEPHSTYGAAKAAIDALVQVRWREAGTPCIALRQFNCYGPNETHDYVIPTIISQIHRNGPIVRLGNDSARDFLYAEDAVRVMVELIEYGEMGGVYNSGSQEAIRIYDLARLIGRLMGHSEIEIQKDESRVRKWEIWHLQADCAKLNSVIRYRPQTSFEDGLRKTIESFRKGGCRWTFESSQGGASTSTQ